MRSIQPDVAARRYGSVVTRSLEQRTEDARTALSAHVDAWIATASPDGRPHLVPLSIAYASGTLLAATAADSPTAANVAATGRARAALGELRDVVSVLASARSTPWASAPPALTSAFVEQRAWDPGDEYVPFVLVELQPRRIQVWRSVAEIEGRDVMRRGVWLVDDAARS